MGNQHSVTNLVPQYRKQRSQDCQVVPVCYLRRGLRIKMSPNTTTGVGGNSEPKTQATDVNQTRGHKVL